ncbi:hypothetical protein QJS04_geneDACA009620 [Acorus gramineus]|uniref:Uncharacterized protein n=1 Tax=Acorus gramineus TaxID=55184 RepID=A0AAV9BCW8_ACOGR|nr:hypothetical protein QJS04_geneDACA009620 [Acorus gramineus]
MDQSIIHYYPTQNPKQAHVSKNRLRKPSENFSAYNSHGALTTHQSFVLSQNVVLPSLNRPPLLPLPFPNTSYRGLLGRPVGNPKSNVRSTDRRRIFAPSAKKPKPSRPAIVAASMKMNDGRAFEELSGSGFLVSPPPSSLPLPRFCLKSKTDEAVGVDAGATDGLRRLLRI